MFLMFHYGPGGLAVWFPPERRGTAMGVWGSWVPAGALLMLNLSPVLATRSWTPAWWLGAAYAAVMLLVFARFFRLPPQGEPRRPRSRRT
jgi:nitrate/nitrite transporter NarK